MPEKILVVEDDPTLQETLAYNLEHQGYDVTSASDGQAAEIILRVLSNSYSIIIDTNSMQPTVGASNITSFIVLTDDRSGNLMEYGPTTDIFTNPNQISHRIS